MGVGPRLRTASAASAAALTTGERHGGTGRIHRARQHGAADGAQPRPARLRAGRPRHRSGQGRAAARARRQGRRLAGAGGRGDPADGRPARAPGAITDVVPVSPSTTYAFATAVARILARDVSPGGTVDITYKDEELDTPFAKQLAVPLLVVNVTQQLYQMARAAGLN